MLWLNTNDLLNVLVSEKSASNAKRNIESYTQLCSDGISLVGKYIDGLLEQFLIPWSVLKRVKLCSSYDGRSLRNSITDCRNITKLINNLQLAKSRTKHGAQYNHLCSAYEPKGITHHYRPIMIWSVHVT